MVVGINAPVVGRRKFKLRHAASFNGTDESMQRTFGAGDKRKWILSLYGKMSASGTDQMLLATNSANNDAGNAELSRQTANKIRLLGWASTWFLSTNAFTFAARTHVLLSLDTANVTAVDRIQCWVDGVQETNAAADLGLNVELAINQAAAHYLGRRSYDAVGLLAGDLAQVTFLGGVSIQTGDHAVTDFYNGGPVDVKSYARGTNGFLLDFSDSAALGADQGAGTNDFTLNNMDATNQIVL